MTHTHTSSHSHLYLRFLKSQIRRPADATNQSFSPIFALLKDSDPTAVRRNQSITTMTHIITSLSPIFALLKVSDPPAGWPTQSINHSHLYLRFLKTNPPAVRRNQSITTMTNTHISFSPIFALLEDLEPPAGRHTQPTNQSSTSIFALLEVSDKPAGRHTQPTNQSPTPIFALFEVSDTQAGRRNQSIASMTHHHHLILTYICAS
jgi:hypothetical protein